MSCRTRSRRTRSRIRASGSRCTRCASKAGCAQAASPRRPRSAQPRSHMRCRNQRATAARADIVHGPGTPREWLDPNVACARLGADNLHAVALASGSVPMYMAPIPIGIATPLSRRRAERLSHSAPARRPGSDRAAVQSPAPDRAGVVRQVPAMARAGPRCHRQSAARASHARVPRAAARSAGPVARRLHALRVATRRTHSALAHCSAAASDRLGEQFLDDIRPQPNRGVGAGFMTNAL